MRLLNTSTLHLSEFIGDVPRYAILSHTWAEEEVLFRDLERYPSAKAGWAKVQAACKLARSKGHAWIWIDTCCIDKASSAELSEAINSMYKWYQEAVVCFAYLADVPYHEHGTVARAAALAKSRWFTRGWTLQELLAPVEVYFYSSDWRLLSSRKELRNDIEEITGIEAAYLSGPWSTNVTSASVAQRMCWASTRKTTRIEDIAYCLLGIFSVSMPLIYGEGLNAFKRLQEAVLREYDDQSIFAWGRLQDSFEDQFIPPSTPLLADGPWWFETSGDIVPFWTPNIDARLRIDHDGVTFTTPLWKEAATSWTTSWDASVLAPLQCRRVSDPLNCIAIRLSITNQGANPSPQPSVLTCSRQSVYLYPITRRAWLESNLCQAFVNYSGTRKDSMVKAIADKGCVVRTLPRGYTAAEVCTHLCDHTERPHDDKSETKSIIPVPRKERSGMTARSYGLAHPAVVRLKGPSLPDLALVLQFQYLSEPNPNGGPEDVIWPDSPGWMINRVVVAPEALSTREIAIIAGEESKAWTVSEIRGLTGWGEASQEVPATNSLLNRGMLKLFTGFNLKLSQDTAYGPYLFLVDVTDPNGDDVSLEATHQGQFCPVRGQGIK